MAGRSALKIAERLGYEFYNKEIILQAAKYSNVDMDSLRGGMRKCRPISASPRAYLIFIINL